VSEGPSAPGTPPADSPQENTDDSPRFDRAVIALGFARMADAVANSFLVIVLPLYIASGEVRGESLGLSESALTGIILAIFGFFNAFMQPFAGRLSDRLGRRRVFVIGGLLALALFNSLYMLADSYLGLLLIRVGQGLSVAFTIVATVALVNELSDRSNRGGNMGIYNSLRLVGFGTGPLVAGFVVAGGPYRILGASLTGFDAAFVVATSGALIGAGLVVLLVRDSEQTTVATGRVKLAVRARDGAHLLDPIFTLGLASLIMAACIALLGSIEPQVNERLGQDARWFGVQFGVFILSLAATQPLIGTLSDRWGRKPFIVLGSLLLAPTTLTQGLVLTPVAMLLARLAQGIAGAMVFSPALALAGDLARKGQSGLQLSVLTMAFGIGLSIGQLMAGFLVGLGYVVPFATGAVLALGSTAVVWTQVEEPDPARPDPSTA
jgi:MFS family permease